MKLKKVCSIVITITVAISIVSPQKYPQISDCVFHNRGIHEAGHYNVTFVCSAIDGGKEDVFIDSTSHVNCTKNLHHTSWVGAIDFKDCQFTKIQRDFFETYKNLHTFTISNVDLEEISANTFKNAKNLTNLIIAQNQLEEIPPLAFVNAQKLQKLDFSKNSIKRIDTLAFVGLKNLASLDLSHNNFTRFGEKVFKELSNLKFLNLSYNQINGLEVNVLTLPSLQGLDLAYNNFTELNSHAFDELSSLKQLNLSFNPIGQLKPETFAFLISLEDLNLKQTSIGSIAMGTFAHQQSLISLDLSDNLLRTMDFKLFFPNLPDLLSLRLANNQLSELKNFRNSLFPQLLSLDIQKNDFNCSYLENFLETVNWDRLRMTINPYLVNTSKPNIRGINCKEVNVTHQSDGAQEISDRKAHSNTFMVVLQFTICFINLVFLILFVILNRKKIYNCFRRSTRLNLIINEIPSQTVEYSNTEYLIS